MRPRLGLIQRCRKRDLDPKKPGHKICLYSKGKPKKLLGRHRTKASARRQEVAIKASQRRRGKRKRK